VAFARKRGRSWYAYWDEYEDGKRVTRAQSWGRDKKAAEDFVLLKNADRIRGVQEPSKQTLHSFWKTYEDAKIPSLTEKVQDTYSKMYQPTAIHEAGHTVVRGSYGLATKRASVEPDEVLSGVPRFGALSRLEPRGRKRLGTWR
jgi:hypothetical protein